MLVVGYVGSKRSPRAPTMLTGQIHTVFHLFTLPSIHQTRRAKGGIAFERLSRVPGSWCNHLSAQETPWLEDEKPFLVTPQQMLPFSQRKRMFLQKVFCFISGAPSDYLQKKKLFITSPWFIFHNGREIKIRQKTRQYIWLQNIH